MRRPRRRLRSGIKVQFHRNEIIDFEPVNVRELLESGGIRPLEFKFEQMAREFRLTEKVVASLRETDLVTPKAIVNVGIKGLRKIDGIGKATAERMFEFAVDFVTEDEPELVVEPELEPIEG